ncbi:MAG TPA: hypothetical protein VFR69_00955 [Rubrobacteraceae bacterium]|nr:hypothetical protein [Rubrobacteraceae bacterium]
MTDEVPQDIAGRRYERWVMRAAELVHGDYPEDRAEAERVLLMRLRDGFVGNVPPTDLWGESTLDEVSAYFSEYGGSHLEAARSLVFALYSAAGGEEWSLVIEGEKDRNPASVRVRGTSLESPDRRVDTRVALRSLACEDADDLRALHERIVGELPRRRLSVEEAANGSLKAVEEMQGMLEEVREISDVLDTREEMSEVHAALENLWMVLAGIAAVEEDRRLRHEKDSRTEGRNTPEI